MVKLTDEQKAMLEALENMPDEEIDYSDIPPIRDWSGFKMGLFYRPKWKDINLKIDEYAIDCFERNLAGGQSLDKAINKALSAQMFRIRFPVRVQKTEKAVRRIQESPEEIENLMEIQKQEIEILYAVPVEEVAAYGSALDLMDQPNSKSGSLRQPAMKAISLNLDENVIDWFEDRLEDGQSLDEAVNIALMDHIHWIRFPEQVKREEEAARQAGETS